MDPHCFVDHFNLLASVAQSTHVVVQDLQILNVKGKTKRSARGKIRRKASWKKAYVRLEAGHEIDFAEVG